MKVGEFNLSLMIRLASGYSANRFAIRAKDGDYILSGDTTKGYIVCSTSHAVSLAHSMLPEVPYENVEIVIFKKPAWRYERVGVRDTRIAATITYIRRPSVRRRAYKVH